MLGYFFAALTGLALVILGRVPMKQAVGTSRRVIALNSASGFLGYRGKGNVPWGFVLRFAGVAVPGILAGTASVHHISTRQATRAFAALLVVLAVLILRQNRAQF